MPSYEKRKELEAKIAEVEACLAKLRERLQKEIEAEQHDAIDHLDTYFDEAGRKFYDFSELWKLIREEMNDIFQPEEKEKK